MYQPQFTEETTTLVFREKSQEYPGGRIAFLADGRIVFPEVRFHPRIGEKYPCRVRFYQKKNTVIGIAYPVDTDKLPEDEYLREGQLVVGVTFVRERGSSLVARHPVTGAYIVPTDPSADLITEGVQCWTMIVQRGTSLVAHYVKDVEGAEGPPTIGTVLALRDPSFAARAEQALREEKGMGRAPAFQFQGKPLLPWEILRILKDAEIAEIRKAYKALAKTLHPDQNPGVNPENFTALAHAHDWMFFRHQWIDGVTTGEKTPVRPKVKRVKKAPGKQAGPAAASA